MHKYDIGPMKEPYKLINYWTRDRVVLIGMIISGLIYNIGLILGPIYQGKLIDGLQSNEATGVIAIIALEFVLSIVIVQGARYFKRLYIRRFANNTSAEMRFSLYNSLLYKSRKEIEEENSGDIMAKAISDVSVCTEGMRKFSTEVFDTGIFMISYIIMMFIYDVKITLISCVFIPVAMYIAGRLKKIIYKFTSTYRKRVSEFSEDTYEYVDNAILYRLYGMDEQNENIYTENLEALKKSAIKSEIWGGSLQPLYEMISMIGIVGVIYFGGMNVYNGKWTVGIFSAYITIFVQMAFKASKTSKLFNAVQKSLISWKRIKPYMENYKEYDCSSKISGQSFDEENRECKELHKFKDNNQNGQAMISLKIDDLCFSYDGSKNIINNMNMNIQNGMIIGVTGQISCGKSTFGRLFLGGYDYKGSITINGVELNDYDEIGRSNLISYMGHDPHLLSDTIYNNITLGNNLDIAEVIKDVCFDVDLKSMKDGINTIVGNGGVRLSGGQQARIALARCLIRKTPILILDDPFSAVDMETEKRIIKNLDKIKKDTIIILISHRLSAFKYADNIIVMNNQGDYEYGKEEELLEKSKLYKSLYDLQMEGNKEAILND